MMREVKMKNTVAYIIVTVLALSLIAITPAAHVVKAEATGYLAIKDYLGKTWSISDVQKIINTTVNTPDGPKSLADYFWIVIDDDPQNKKYNLRDFTVSPLDNVTAVLPLPEGDHYVDIYWFGFHQRQLVNIVENTHYVLNLETAPVVPFNVTSNNPPSSAEWDLAYSPDGLKIQRRDGNAYVLFKYNASYIEVAWYDEDLGGWNYQSLDIYIDTSYQYKFHIKDPSDPQYYEERTGSFLWLNWDVYKVKEKVKWNRTGEILHVVYAVAVSENEALLQGAEEFWSGVASALLGTATSFIDPVTGTIVKLKGFVDLVHSAYDTYMGELYSSKYSKTALIVWDVFATPTQIVVLAHAYDVQQDGTLVKKPITSVNAFTIDNRLVYIRMLQGGYAFQQYAYVDLSGVDDYTISNSYNFRIVKDPVYSKLGMLALPTMRRIHVDDLSMYDYILWYSFSKSLTWKLIIGFNSDEKANAFKNALDSNGISYTVDATGKIFTFTAGSGTLVINEFENIEELIPTKSSGFVQLWIDPVAGDNGITGWLKLYYAVMPKLEPPQISLLENGYQTVTGAFAVQVFKDVFRSDDVYMLGYYLLGNDPPPVYIINDAYYDIDQDKMHYVKTVVTVDAYGQDITQETGSTRVIPQDLYIEAISKGNVQFGIKVYYDRVYYQLNTLAPDEHAYLHIVLKNGTVIKVFDGVQGSESGTIYYSDYGIMFENILYIISYIGDPNYEGVQIVYYDGTTGVTKWTDAYFEQQDPPRLEYSLNIRPTIRLLENVTLALFDFNKMSFLNLAPEVIEYLLFAPPNEGGWGTPIIDWSTVSIVTVNFSKPYELYYYDKPSNLWILVDIVFYNDTKIYDVKRHNDSVLVEKLEPGDTSQYYYKLVYTDTNTTYKGWLFNDNGVLKLITGQVTWSLTDQELQLLLESVQLQGIIDQWTQTWNQIAEQLGLIASAIGKTGGTSIPWTWLLIGGGLVIALLIIIAASKPGVNVVLSPRGFRYSKVGGKQRCRL